ncbi:C1QL [Mytilus edulis]|uniref:C1QL n=1 Tax=Mytilus edulis TaxID=6550 RepID=A0A8S3SQ74_MYTED|nr:C1QL [Mytilus edulis]
MDIVRTFIILYSLSVAGKFSSSIGSEFESLNTCSKFHFEEKVLEKLVRLELKMQLLEEKVMAWDNSITSKLDKMGNIKKETETFVQLVQDSQIRDQMQFNNSYQEAIKQFKAKVNNETSSYGDKMNTLLESLSSKIQMFSEAEKKRERVIELMQFTLHQEQKRFNTSFEEVVEMIKVNSNKTLHELISKHQTDFYELVKKRETVAFSAYRKSHQDLSKGTKILFNQVWTNVGNGYNPSTGIFTAPNACLYHITAVVMSAHGDDLYLRLYHNGLAMSGSYNDGDGYKTGTFDIVLNLQKGDKVYIAAQRIDKIYSDGNTYVTFSGHSVW